MTEDPFEKDGLHRLADEQDSISHSDCRKEIKRLMEQVDKLTVDVTQYDFMMRILIFEEEKLLKKQKEIEVWLKKMYDLYVNDRKHTEEWKLLEELSEILKK